MEENKDYGNVCAKHKCEHFRKWSFDCGNCESCDIVGQSYWVDTVPSNCPYLEEMDADKKDIYKVE